MSVTVRYFASLRESMQRESVQVEMDEQSTVADVWQRASGGLAPPPNTLAAVNLDYRPFSHPVRDGDEVAFFPPVTGG